MRFSALTERISGEGANAWVTHAEARRALDAGEDVILLSVGDPDLQSPSPVVDRAVECLRSGDTHYTPAIGRDTLRAAIAAQHQARCGQAVTGDNVAFLAGAQNALFAASLCLAGPGDDIIAFDPLYATYPATIEASGARLVRAPAPAESDFRIDVAALRSLITARTRALFFATPNNPSGRILGEAELTQIGELARAHDLWVVADEVYAGLAPGGRVPSLARHLPERVVTISSLSKTHAMPGWRAGWMVADPSLIRHVESLAMCMLYGLPGFVQEAALTALGESSAAEERIRQLCASRCALLARALEDIPQLRCVVPEAGMFMLVDVRGTGLTGEQFMRQLYRAQRVSVLDGGAFGAGTSGFVRICFAAPEAELREACRRIRQFVSASVTHPTAALWTP